MSSGGETSGFRLTHTGLRVSNLDSSIRFYTGVFGMQELGRISMETTTIVFLGFASSVAPGTGLFAREGVLELTCGTKKPSGETGKLADYADTRFVKLCFSVPDVSEAVSRMERHNVKFVQKDKEVVGSREIAKFLGAEDPEKGFDAQFWEMSKAVPFVEDPDGYLIEVLPNNAALP